MNSTSSSDGDELPSEAEGESQCEDSAIQSITAPPWLRSVRELCASIGVEALQTSSGTWTYPWAHPDARFCLFMYADVLGFSRMLSTDIPLAAHAVRALRREARLVSHRVPSREGFKGRFGYYVAIDTVIFFLADLSDAGLGRAFSCFLERCASLYLCLLGSHRIKLRGVISAAPQFVAEADVFVTPNLPRCHEIELAQDWSGIAIDADELTRAVGPLSPRSSEIIPCYVAALKNVPLGACYVLNATMPAAVTTLERRGIGVAEIEEALNAELGAEDLPGAVENKIKNTLTYLSWCMRVGKVVW